jgi:hypothetical protein
MPRRAKTSALFLIFGTLAATAAPLSLTPKNPAYQPGIIGQTPRSRPAHSPVWTKVPLWTGAKVEKITLSRQAQPRVELNGFVFTRASGALIRPAPARVAGNGR